MIGWFFDDGLGLFEKSEGKYLRREIHRETMGFQSLRRVIRDIELESGMERSSLSSSADVGLSLLPRIHKLWWVRLCRDIWLFVYILFRGEGHLEHIYHCSGDASISQYNSTLESRSALGGHINFVQ
jgi:hypothetical protein